MSCREIVEQDLTLKIQKVGQKAKRPQNKKNIPTHPMTMPLKRLGKKAWATLSHVLNKLNTYVRLIFWAFSKNSRQEKFNLQKNSTKRGGVSLLPKFQSEHVHM